MTLKHNPGQGTTASQLISCPRAAPQSSVRQREFDLTDEKLAREACHSATAFATLYHRYFHRVYGYHLSRTDNVEDAQDLTSQTFVAALEGIASYRGRGSFAAWLFSIAYHKMADHFRSAAPQVSLEAALELPHPDPSPEDVAAERTQLSQINHAMSQLAPERAEALRLRVYGGLDAAETGRVMGKSAAAVKMLVYRALEDLRRLFDLQEDK